MRGWIGVDLDGTLAKSVKAQTGEEIGAPIGPMVQLVRGGSRTAKMSAFSRLGSIPIISKATPSVFAELLKRGVNATSDKFSPLLMKRTGTWCCCLTTEHVRLNTTLAGSSAVTHAKI